MGMDFLRTCYQSYMRLFKDDPDRLTLGRWAWSPPGSRPVPFPHLFGSAGFDPQPMEPEPPIGEVYGLQGRATGYANPRYKGLNYCGPVELWQHGSPLILLGTPPVDVEGVPLCCVTAGIALGGAVANGSGIFDRPTPTSGNGTGRMVAALKGVGIGLIDYRALGYGTGLVAADLTGVGKGMNGAIVLGVGTGLVVAGLKGGGTGHAYGPTTGNGTGLVVAQLKGGGTGHAYTPIVGTGTGKMLPFLDGFGTAEVPTAGAGSAKAATFIDGFGQGHAHGPVHAYLGTVTAGSAVLVLDPGQGPLLGVVSGATVAGAGIGPTDFIVLGVVGDNVTMDNVALASFYGTYTFS